MANEETFFIEKVRHPSNNTWINMREVGFDISTIEYEGSPYQWTSSQEKVLNYEDNAENISIENEEIIVNWNIDEYKQGYIIQEPGFDSNGIIVIQDGIFTTDNQELSYCNYEYPLTASSAVSSSWTRNSDGIHGINIRFDINPTIKVGDFLVIPNTDGSNFAEACLVRITNVSSNSEYLFTSSLAHRQLSLNYNSELYFSDLNGNIYDHDDISINSEFTQMTGNSNSGIVVVYDEPSISVIEGQHYLGYSIFYVDSSGNLTLLIDGQEGTDISIPYVYSLLTKEKGIDTLAQENRLNREWVDALLEYSDFYSANNFKATIYYQVTATVQNFHYNKNIIKYYDGNNELLNVGRYNTPVFIEDGQFKETDILSNLNTNFTPGTQYEYNIGSSDNPWNNIYGHSLILNNENQVEGVTVTADVAGNLLVNGDIKDVKNNNSLFELSSVIKPIRNKNTVFAAPANVDGVPSFRTLTASDIPTELPTLKITSTSAGSLSAGGTIAFSDNMGRIQANTTSMFFVHYTDNQEDRRWRFNTDGSIHWKDAKGTGTVTQYHHIPYYDTLTQRAQNTVLAAPTNAVGAATFRKIVANDISSVNADKITSGTLNIARLQKSYYQATNATAVSITNTVGTKVKIPLSSTTGQLSAGSDLAITSGGILVKTTGRYRISASAYVHATTTSNSGRGVYVIKVPKKGAFVPSDASKEVLGATILLPNYTQQGGINCGPKIIICNADDILYLAGRVMNGKGEIPAQNSATYLLVERIS